MMLGDVIPVNSGAIIGFDQPQAIGVQLAERHARIVHVIEDAELHESSPNSMAGTTPALIPACLAYRHSTFLIS